MAPPTTPAPVDMPSDTEPFIRAVHRLNTSEQLSVRGPDGRQVEFLVVPEGRSIKSLKPITDEQLPLPERKKGTATLTTIDSFIDHLNRFKDADSAIFADVDRKDPVLLGVLDYHRSGAGRDLPDPTAPQNGQARWGQHRASYAFPVSDQWKAWTNKTGPMGLAEFAEFLEDRISDVRDPAEGKETGEIFARELRIRLATPHELLELSRGITINVGAKVINAQVLSSGETEMHFSEQHEGQGGKALNIPGGFLLSIPVFRGGNDYLVPVRLRYRVQGAQVVWWFALAKVDKVWDHAIAQACDKATSETTLPLFYGRPEA